MKVVRDHIFISYATEQSALCDWLARRLAAEGYAIWCDRQKLLGGENWPNDIDAAINERTFRMLALLSRASMNKQNPQGEWLKGNAIGKKLGIVDFVIPLNTEGLRPDEITWNLQPINYIPFTPSWAEGLAALLKKLTSLDAPRSLRDGPRIAVGSMVANSTIRDESEILVSNCFEIVQTPRYIRKYTSETNLSPAERRVLRKEWACRDLSPTLVIAFDDPTSTVKERYSFSYVNQVSWRDTPFINGIKARDLVVNLVHKSLHRLLEGRGLKYSDGRRQWYIPPGLLAEDNLTFTSPDGKKRWFKAVSERTFHSRNGGEVYRYHLSPSLSLLRDQTDPFVLFLRNRVYFTDTNGKPLDERKIVSRRKHLCKAWFNYEWWARTLGVAQLLADEDMYIRFGPEGEQQLVINAVPISLDVSKGIDDDHVDESDGYCTTWLEGVGLEVDIVSVIE